MQFMLKGILAVIWLILLPCAAGIPFLKKKKNDTLGECFLAGFLVMLCLGELIILPAIYLKLSLHTVTWVYGVIFAGIALYGLFCMKEKCRRYARQIKEGIRKASPYLWLALVLIAVQVLIVVRFAHMDADDAFYIGTASTAIQTDTVFAVDAYTGVPYTSLPSRYVLSPFPVLLAVMSRLCAGIHPAVMAHVFYPAVFVPAAYLVLYMLGKKWFPSDRGAQGTFLLLCALLVWFSGFSVYTSGNFQMVRIWQGKALLCSALLPLVMYLCFSVMLEKQPEYPWILLLMANLACCHVSSMGIMLSPVMMGIFTLIGLWRFRSLKRLLWCAVCCLPSLILGVTYLML